MKCKNCGHRFTEKYCGNCTQKMDTHRLTFKHFFAHDILHGLFHLDGKLPQTIKAILLTPGKVAQEYIAGKRKKYYGFFYLLLMLLGIYIFFDSLTTNQSELKKNITNTPTFIDEHFKLIVFLIIPFIASVTWLFFRRLKYNIIECHVLGVVVLIGYVTILDIDVIIYSLLNKINLTDNIVHDVFNGVLNIVAIMIYPIYAFYSFIKKQYSLAGRIWRITAAWIIVIMFFAIVTAGFALTEELDKSGLSLREFIKLEKKNKKIIIKTNKSNGTPSKPKDK